MNASKVPGATAGPPRQIKNLSSSANWTILTNEYDGNHHRIQKWHDGGTWDYYYNHKWQVIAEAVNGVADSLYAWHHYYIDALAVRFKTSSKHVFTHDANFNVTAAFDVKPGSGTYRQVVERYHYTPYGEVTFLDGSFGTLGGTGIGNRHLFAGRQRDAETHLYDFRTRFYHPPLGRFTTRDWIEYGGGMNLYGYVGGMPTRFVDPFGLEFPDWDLINPPPAFPSHSEIQSQWSEFQSGIPLTVPLLPGQFLTPNEMAEQYPGQPPKPTFVPEENLDPVIRDFAPLYSDYMDAKEAWTGYDYENERYMTGGEHVITVAAVVVPVVGASLFRRVGRLFGFFRRHADDVPCPDVPSGGGKPPGGGGGDGNRRLWRAPRNDVDPAKELAEGFDPNDYSIGTRGPYFGLDDQGREITDAFQFDSDHLNGLQEIPLPFDTYQGLLGNGILLPDEAYRPGSSFFVPSDRLDEFNSAIQNGPPNVYHPQGPKP